MKLFLSSKEASLIKVALHLERVNMTQEQRAACDIILERMELCEQLQKCERKSKAMERV